MRVDYLLAINTHNFSYLDTHLGLQGKGNNHSVSLSFQARAATMKNLYERQGDSIELL